MLRTRTIVLWGAGLLVVAGVAATLLGGGHPEDSARLDALKTGANIVVGGPASRTLPSIADAHPEAPEPGPPTSGQRHRSAV